jgi:tellurite resistance protein
MSSRTQIPLNTFGIPFGLAGLGACWLSLTQADGAPEAVGDTFVSLAAVAWMVVIVLLARSTGWTLRRLASQLADPIGGPFGALAVIVPMLFASLGIYPHAPTAGRVILDVFAALTALLGAWYTGQWIYRPLELDSLHPGYFLPTVAGGLVAAAGAATVQQPALAEVMFGLGAVCWLLLGSIILNRLLVGPMLPPPLLPTLAIEVAPAAVASIAWFAMNGNQVDLVARLLAGYGLLMTLAQIRLLPAYLRLPFMPSTWAFTFSWAAVATVGVHWLHLERPAGYRAYEYLVVGVITAFILGVLIRTLSALTRGVYLPRPAAAPSSATDSTSTLTPTTVEPEDALHGTP